MSLLAALDAAMVNPIRTHSCARCRLRCSGVTSTWTVPTVSHESSIRWLIWHGYR
jgi:hypothetical protein